MQARLIVSTTVAGGALWLHGENPHGRLGPATIRGKHESEIPEDSAVPVQGKVKANVGRVNPVPRPAIL